MSYDLYILDGAAPEDDEALFALMDELDDLNDRNVELDPTPRIAALVAAANERWPDWPVDVKDWPWAEWPPSGNGRWMELHLTGRSWEQARVLLQIALDAGLIILDPSEGAITEV